MTTEGHAEPKTDVLEERMVEFAVGAIPIANRLSELRTARIRGTPGRPVPSGRQ